MFVEASFHSGSFSSFLPSFCFAGRTVEFRDYFGALRPSVRKIWKAREHAAWSLSLLGSNLYKMWDVVGVTDTLELSMLEANNDNNNIAKACIGFSPTFRLAFLTICRCKCCGCSGCWDSTARTLRKRSTASSLRYVIISCFAARVLGRVERLDRRPFGWLRV